MHLIKPYRAITQHKTLFWMSLLLGLIFTPTLANATTQATPQGDQAWSFSTDLGIDPLNISGIVVTTDFMALATDEGYQIQLFKPLKTKPGQQAWQPTQVITLDNSMAAINTELDIEGLAWQAPYLYAIGSHSLKRAKLKDNKSEKQNLQRLQTVSREPARQQLFRIQLDAQYKPIAIESLSLAEVLQKHEILGLFSDIPSKENGIDIEGLAIDSKGRLLVGLRGPVLRGNIATVLRLKLSKKAFNIKSIKTVYLPLAGRGIRGLSSIDRTNDATHDVASDFLVLAGAVGDQDLSYQVYYWNGENHLLGESLSQTSLRYLCDLPTSQGKPEGIAFLQKMAKNVAFVIVQDGLKNGQPTVFGCTFN